MNTNRKLLLALNWKYYFRLVHSDSGYRCRNCSSLIFPTTRWNNESNFFIFIIGSNILQAYANFFWDGLSSRYALIISILHFNRQSLCQASYASWSFRRHSFLMRKLPGEKPNFGTEMTDYGFNVCLYMSAWNHSVTKFDCWKCSISTIYAYLAAESVAWLTSNRTRLGFEIFDSLK